MSTNVFTARCFVFIAIIFIAGPTVAQTDIFGAETIKFHVDARTYITSGVASWTRGGSGKTRYGQDDTSPGLDLAEAGLVWQPRFGWTLKGYLHLQYEDTQNGNVGLNEAYMRFKPVPTSAWRWSGRAGIFYPPVSMEHTTEAWKTFATITPSAINSWIGEEVKGLGLELNLKRDFARQKFALTAGLFNSNDAAGILIGIRGWAFHDIKTNYKNKLPLTASPGNNILIRPFNEIDNRIGYYVRGDWSPVSGVDINFIRWDNRADPTARDNKGRAWHTDFVNIGAAWQITDQLQLIGQAMDGVTVVGTRNSSGRFGLDFAYRAAFILLVREKDDHIQSARIDVFEVKDRSNWVRADTSENGWAATIAWRYKFTGQHSLIAELLHIKSDRQQRVRLDGPGNKSENQFQISWRISL